MAEGGKSEPGEVKENRALKAPCLPEAEFCSSCSSENGASTTKIRRSTAAMLADSESSSRIGRILVVVVGETGQQEMLRLQCGRSIRRRAGCLGDARGCAWRVCVDGEGDDMGDVMRSCTCESVTDAWGRRCKRGKGRQKRVKYCYKKVSRKWRREKELDSRAGKAGSRRCDSVTGRFVFVMRPNMETAAATRQAQCAPHADVV